MYGLDPKIDLGFLVGKDVLQEFRCICGDRTRWGRASSGFRIVHAIARSHIAFMERPPRIGRKRGVKAA